MGLSNFNIKKILIFSQRKTFLIFPETEPCTSQPKPPKKTKKSTRNKFLVFPEMELSSSNIKRIHIFAQKKALIFSQKKAFLTFPKMEPCTFKPKLKK